MTLAVHKIREEHSLFFSNTPLNHFFHLLQFLRRRLDTLTGSTKEVIEQFLQKDFVGLHEDLKSFAKSAEKKVVENNNRKKWTTDSEYLNSRNSRFFNY